jgi:hypothetical protein
MKRRFPTMLSVANNVPERVELVGVGVGVLVGVLVGVFVG